MLKVLKSKYSGKKASEILGVKRHTLYKYQRRTN